MTPKVRAGAPAAPGDLTDDAFLGGRLRLFQPRAGHRSGSDALLLAAAARSRLGPGASIVDLGAGAGAVGLALGLFGASVVALVEIDPDLAALAAENARRNGLGDRVAAVAADVATLGTRAGPPRPAPSSVDLVVANPPFDDSTRFRASPDAGKALAHAAGEDLIETWTKTAARLLKPGGAFVLIHRPQALPALFAAFGRRFGDIRLRPLAPGEGAPASRVLVAARKGRRGALALLPGLTMHGPDGAFSPEIDAAQRGEVGIEL